MTTKEIGELQKYVGQKFYDVYTERASDGGAMIRCFDCGIGLPCRDEWEVVQSVKQLVCPECRAAIRSQLM